MRNAWWTRWRREGFVETASAEDADLVILNTCHIREKASEKVYSELGRLRVAKDEAARQGREMRIAVAGCVAQAEGAEIIRRAPAVDVVVGPQSYHHLPQLLARAKSEGRALETEFPVEDKFGFLPPPNRMRSARAASPLSSPCRKAATSSAPSAWCPIRAARKSRARWRRSSTT